MHASGLYEYMKLLRNKRSLDIDIGDFKFGDSVLIG